MAYVQTRIQSRYGDRADTSVWLRLHNIQDIGSYLQTAQQTPLRPWVLGLAPAHSSHDIELALRQKYRRHVDEVANWMPHNWQQPLRWIKRLVDLPVLQYLATGGEPLDWMKSDPDLSGFTAPDLSIRLRNIMEAGNGRLIKTSQHGDSMLSGWLTEWNSMRPESIRYDKGLQQIEKLLHEQTLLQTKHRDIMLHNDYETMVDRLRLIFRRYAFQPAAVCAYLFIVAIDHRIRSDLMQRLLFTQVQHIPEEV
ncbi:MAG: hypothetical protein PVG94_02550 [Gammaproteobacteria bacterium]|jgi:hypothetical protein